MTQDVVGLMVIGDAIKVVEAGLADARQTDAIQKFHDWITASHEKFELDLRLLRARRKAIFYSAPSLSAVVQMPEWLGINALIGWAEELYALLDSYAYRITSFLPGEHALTEADGAALWNRYQSDLGVPEAPALSG